MTNKKQAERAIVYLEGIAKNLESIPNLNKVALAKLITEYTNIIKEYLKTVK